LSNSNSNQRSNKRKTDQTNNSTGLAIGRRPPPGEKMEKDGKDGKQCVISPSHHRTNYDHC